MAGLAKDPDKCAIFAYEAGVKMFLAGGRARLNFNIFDYKVDDAQLTAVGGQFNFNQVINANEVGGQGFELDFQARILDSLTVTASVGYTETEINDPNLAVAPCGAPWATPSAASADAP